jgi:hypothetical protein
MMVVATKEKQYEVDFVLDRLQEYVSKFRTKGDAAEALGVGRIFLWRVLEKKSPPTNAILEKIGFHVERKTVHVYTRLL